MNLRCALKEVDVFGLKVCRWWHSRLQLLLWRMAQDVRVLQPVEA